MPGADLRLNRLFRAESTRSVIVAFDRTLAGGPEPYAEDSGALMHRLAHSGVDGVLVGPGLLKQHGHVFGFRGAPATLCRIDFPYVGAFARGSGEEYGLLVDPEEALALGADALVMFLISGNEEQSTWRRNVEAVASVSARARRLGLPLVVEAVPWGPAHPDSHDPRAVADICRIAAELGADAVKTEHPGSVDGMREVVDGCPVPVLVLGGPKVDDLGALTDFAGTALAGGARGVIFGRNMWQRPDADDAIGAVLTSVHGT